MSKVLLILIAIFIVWYVYYMSKEYNENKYVKSEVDGNSYLIRNAVNKDAEYLQNSADVLADINKRIKMLISHLLKTATPETQNFVEILNKNYNHSVLSEAALDNRYTTYTIDKQSMHICLRTRDTQQKLYDINILMYVILHELAHLCNYHKNGLPIVGHGPEFKKIFKHLVEKAIEIGVYEYQDFVRKPKEYCGLVINTSIV